MAHQMEHFRGGKLYAAEALHLESLEGYLTFREKSGGRREWHGYIEVPNDKYVEPGAQFRLVLADGRSAEINASDIPGSGTPGKSTHAVEFYVRGDMKGQRRGMDSLGRKLCH